MSVTEMSVPSITPAEVCQSAVQFQPLLQPTNIEVIKTFKKLVQTCIGYRGKLKVIGSAAGGHVTLTSSSVRLLQNISIRNNFIRFITSSTKSHLSSYNDNGLLCAFLTSHIVDTSLDLSVPKTTVSELIEYFGHLYVNYLSSVKASCTLEVDFSDTSSLLTVIQNVLSSKPACALSQCQVQHLSLLLLKAFLKSVPDSSAAYSKKMSEITFSTLEGVSVDGCHLYSGLLIRCPEITGGVSLSELKHTGRLKVALFTVSLAGDAVFPTDHLEVSCQQFSVWKIVLAQLQMIALRLIGDGVHIVACQKVIHPILKKQLEDSKVLVIERLGHDVTEHLKHISGAIPVSSLSTSCKMVYGYITGFENVRLGKKQYYLMENKEQPLQTLFLCSYNEESLNETKVVCKQALDVLYRLLENPKVCYGGGCTEIHVASIVEKMVMQNIESIAEETDCYPSHVLSVLNNFISCVVEVAVSFHQGCHLSFATDTVHHHLWKLEGENFPSMGDSCMCGSYRSEDFAASQWQVAGKQISCSKIDHEGNKPYFRDHAACKPKLLDELQARVNAFKVAFETSALLMNINLCILNKN